jgi:hypothetical protein
MSGLEILLKSIEQEVRRARELHRPTNTLHEGYAVILEEVEEFWDEVKVNPKKLDTASQDKRIDNMRKELIQVAAMCIRTILDCNIEEKR